MNNLVKSGATCQTAQYERGMVTLGQFHGDLVLAIQQVGFHDITLEGLSENAENIFTSGYVNTFARYAVRTDALCLLL